MKNPLVTTIIVALIVGAATFFGGMKYAQAAAAKGQATGSADHQQFGNRQGGQNGQNRFTGSRPVIGEVTSQDATSITVKLQDGSSKIVLLPDTVTVSKTDAGSKADITTGVRVGVFGTTNSDGSVTAQNVQLNPMFRDDQNRPHASGQ